MEYYGRSIFYMEVGTAPSCDMTDSNVFSGKRPRTTFARCLVVCF